MFRPRTRMRASHERQEPMVPPASTLQADDRANELYWGSDRSVNQIAEELDLSKGALYGLIRPLAAALGCPECGVEVVHPNRTAKDRGLVDCPVCEWKGPEVEAVTEFEPGVALGEDGLVRLDTRYAPNGADPRPLVAAALLGAAAGLALILWARRR